MLLVEMTGFEPAASCSWCRKWDLNPHFICKCMLLNIIPTKACLLPLNYISKLIINFYLLPIKKAQVINPAIKVTGTIKHNHQALIIIKPQNKIFGNQWATYLSYSLSLQPLWGTPLRLSTLLSVKTSIKRAGLASDSRFELLTHRLEGGCSSPLS